MDAKPDVNATPLIDVLLVLLVMLILTIPVATHQTSIHFPGQPIGVLSPEVRLAIDFDGRMYWNGNEIANEAELLGYLRYVASSSDQPLLRVEPDRRARYEHVAQVLAAAQRSQIERLTVSGVID